MRTHFKLILIPAVAALVNCNHPDSTAPAAEPSSVSKKAPLVFDETPLLYPPASGKGQNPALEKSASTYYLFWAPSQIDWSDCNYWRVANGYDFTCGTGYYYTNFAEGTYSSRVAGTPASMWQPVSGMKGLQNMVLLDNEQAEIHLFPRWTGWWIQVDLDYEISSETNFDYLWINSTASNGSCNSPGVVHKKVSGVGSGHVSFQIPPDCQTPWIGIYYIKDVSLSANGDYARIKNVNVWPMIPVGKTSGMN